MKILELRPVSTLPITGWDEDEKKKAVISARYLNSVAKGENALELAYQLETNFISREPQKFVIPQYISDGLTWICS